jgi:hypothetical protein
MAAKPGIFRFDPAQCERRAMGGIFIHMMSDDDVRIIIRRSRRFLLRLPRIAGRKGPRGGAFLLPEASSAASIKRNLLTPCGGLWSRPGQVAFGPHNQ